MSTPHITDQDREVARSVMWRGFLETAAQDVAEYREELLAQFEALAVVLDGKAQAERNAKDRMHLRQHETNFAAGACSGSAIALTEAVAMIRELIVRLRGNT